MTFSRSWAAAFAFAIIETILLPHSPNPVDADPVVLDPEDWGSEDRVQLASSVRINSACWLAKFAASLDKMVLVSSLFARVAKATLGSRVMFWMTLVVRPNATRAYCESEPCSSLKSLLSASQSRPKSPKDELSVSKTIRYV